MNLIFRKKLKNCNALNYDNNIVCPCRAGTHRFFCLLSFFHPK